ncbi:MAG: hypothetical protein GXP15_15045 [Gammaproteobacteria bacterium]|nr:hypothetical protein [Gammaproteobacteria bacterium]
MGKVNNRKRVTNWLAGDGFRGSETSIRSYVTRVGRFATLFILLFTAFGAQATDAQSDRPFTMEYYYRIKLGYFDEWIALYKKNHWPVMMAEKELGQVLDIKIDRPRGYRPESDRWDVRVTITFKNLLIPHGMTDRHREETIARLFPDRELFEKEELRRFRLLDGLTEVELLSVKTDDW